MNGVEEEGSVVGRFRHRTREPAEDMLADTVMLDLQRPLPDVRTSDKLQKNYVGMFRVRARVPICMSEDRRANN